MNRASDFANTCYRLPTGHIVGSLLLYSLHHMAEAAQDFWLGMNHLPGLALVQ